MKKIILIVFVLSSTSAFSQLKWFQTYTDKNDLLKDGAALGSSFISDAKKLLPNLKNEPQIIINTTPYGIYYDGKEKTVNMPLWEELSQTNKVFFKKITGNKKDGQKLFGLMFNGFYLPHELGHWLSHENKDTLGSYNDEYWANTVAMLWWKKQGKLKELKIVYKILKKVMKTYPNPVPKGQEVEKYFTENYMKIVNDEENFAKIYGFMQFSQFIKIYEDKSLPDFDKLLLTKFKKIKN